MPQPDLADIIAALPTLTFAPASEAPVSDGWCLVAPADGEWCLARREDERGWFSTDGSHIDEPLVYAALPPPPGRNYPRLAKSLAGWITDLIEDGDYATAASAIDKLADQVRAMRDSRVAE